MSDTLVIEWNRDRLIAAIGSAGSKSVGVRAAVTVSREEGRLLPREIGEALSKALNSTDSTATEAIVVFPRELVTFNRIQLPNIADSEIPSMVALQAATRLTVPVESVCLDFVPLPVAPNEETREVLLVTVPKKYVSDVREALAVCRLELAGVRVSSFGIAASAVHCGLLQNSASTGSVEAIVALGTDSIEMIFMTGTSVAFSHSGASWTSPEGIEQAVRSEISRARMSAAEDMGSYNVSRLTLIGSLEITAAVPDTISKRLNDAKVVRVDPSSLMHGRSPSESLVLPDGLAPSDMLAVVGVIANYQVTSVDSVDLINPRKAAEKKDYSKLIKILIAASIGTILIGGWAWSKSEVSSRTRKIAALKSQTSDLNQKYKMAEQELKLDVSLTEWKDRDFSWLDEMQKIQGLIGGTDRVLIKKFQFSLRTGNFLVLVEAEGVAKSRRDVEDLRYVLADAGYEVTPKEIKTSLRDPNYPTELRLEMSIPATKSKEKPKA